MLLRTIYLLCLGGLWYSPISEVQRSICMFLTSVGSKMFLPNLKSQRCVVITCRVHVFSGIVTDLVLSYVKLTSVHSVSCYQRTLLWDYRQVAKTKNCTADLFCGRCPVLTCTLLVRGATFLL